MRPMPSLRQVGYLIALAQYRHFGRAAEACFVTQSTLSAGIQELESVLAATLVERTKRRVHLTPLGRVMAARGRELMRIAEEMTDLARGAAGPLSGERHIGVIPTIAPFLLPRVLPALGLAFPDLKLSLREDLSARLLEGLDRGELDAVIYALPYAVDGLEVMELGQDPFLLVCPPSHRFAVREAVDPADLPAAELILLQDGNCLTDHALAACRLAMSRGTRTGLGSMLGTSLHTVVQMVAGGMGLTLLPHLAVEAGILRGTDLVARPLIDAGVRTLALAWRHSSPHGPELRLLGGHVAGAISGVGGERPRPAVRSSTTSRSPLPHPG
ncbi:MAG: hydrogen peroxide-inducible genes activator [Rhodospirillaceae bacterium]